MTRFLSLFLLLSFFLASCSKEKQPVFIYDIEDEFRIDIRQSLGNSEDVVIQISTITEMPDNYRIEAGWKIVNGKLELDIFRIQKPNTPSDNYKILTQNVVIDSLGIGTHDINLIIRNSIQNEGAITVLDDQLTIEFTTTEGIINAYAETNRFPKNSFWGVAYVDSSYHATILDIFLDSLHQNAEEVLLPKEGDYGYFSIKEGQISGLDATFGKYHRSIFMTCSDFFIINKKVQEFKSYETGFHAQIHTAQGTFFSNIDKGSDVFSFQNQPSFH